MNEQQTKQPVVGLSDAIERAATALEYRIHLTETESIPKAEMRRNGKVAAVLREGLSNDKAALAVLRATAGDSAKAPLSLLGARVVHFKRAPYDVYIGRPSKWGNPFAIGKDGNRAQVIQKYREWLIQQPDLMAALPELKGKTLGCWCSPQACHGDVLAEMAGAPNDPKLVTQTPKAKLYEKHATIPAARDAH